MPTCNIQFDCEEISISTYSGTRLVNIYCDSADLCDIVNAAGVEKIVETIGSSFEVLDCLPISDVIEWLSNRGYTVYEECDL